MQLVLICMPCSVPTSQLLTAGARLAYRPGVSLLRIPGERAVLVAQRLRGLYPPQDYPKLLHKDTVPRGQSMYLDKHGSFLDTNHDEADRFTMISHVPMQPLETIMPPPEIVEKNRAWLKKARETQQDVEGSPSSAEVRLHMALGGGLSDWHDIKHKFNHQKGIPPVIEY